MVFAPEVTGAGLGSRLVAFAQERQPTRPQSVWAFQSNIRAIRFLCGTAPGRSNWTDGDNGRAPDVRMVWPGAPAPDHQPRSAASAAAGSSLVRPSLVAPKTARDLGVMSGSSWKVVALTIASARWAGLPDLRSPGRRSALRTRRCIILAPGIRGVCDPARGERASREPRRRPPSAGRRAPGVLRRDEQLVVGEVLEAADLGPDPTHMRRRIGDVTGPGLTLGRIIAAPSVIRRRALTEGLVTATDEGHREGPLVDVVGVVGGWGPRTRRCSRP